ncbi:YqjF family protein [Chengkuizengella axinellae]|uniref:DUF2071 domain-containing protein n=1 Tax=Chengkuizengella axinellae TaxID=3064388 RepID=A0ABT9IXV6_9BACL|nr:DUF2071 domain-containing protein [Chengkuizengella sp. 2205SS18-9]MDP5274186.1 DUF2071 domain-containing protein [Chengkuizengella sp. 2205SS18-9]
MSNELLKSTQHREFSVPAKHWVMKQTWNDLLFAHWPIRVNDIRDHIPASLTIDTFDGFAWIGVVPFHMSNIRMRFLPPVPFASSFPEINVRTYVKFKGKAGVFFFSLDAMNHLAVYIARKLFSLNYYYAQIVHSNHSDTYYYESKRMDKDKVLTGFTGVYKPISKPFRSTRDSIDYWLTERYCLFCNDEKYLYRGDIHHVPWQLQHVDADITNNSMTLPIGINLPLEKPIFHFSKKLDALLWSLTKVADFRRTLLD